MRAGFALVAALGLLGLCAAPARATPVLNAANGHYYE